jgi:hypothetical protein
MKKIILFIALTLTGNQFLGQVAKPASISTKTVTIHKKKKTTPTKIQPSKVIAQTKEEESLSIETQTSIPKSQPHPLPIEPKYDGGNQAMLDFINMNKKVPAEVQKNNVTVMVNVSFVITADGSLKNIKAIKADQYGCDAEAERIVKLMPKWIPGKIGRQFIEMAYVISIEFK